MPNLGGAEWIVILVIIILLFGVGRIGQVGGELGKAIREFRHGLSGDDEPGDKPGDKSGDQSKKDDVSKG